MNFNLDNKDFINNEFQNLIFKIKSLANDINQNNDKNANLSQLQNILNNIQYLNKKVIEEINTIIYWRSKKRKAKWKRKIILYRLI